MTREEAQKMCQDIRHYLTLGNPVWSTDEVAKALSMAIEALQQDCAKCDHYSERTGRPECDVNHPLTDAVEVVRCKDCTCRQLESCCPMYHVEHITIDEGGGYYDDDYNIHDYTQDNSYCSWGVRREDGEV